MKINHRRNADRVDQEINVSPLIDVVFILLIFIVSATFVVCLDRDKSAKWNRKSSAQRNPFALSNETNFSMAVRSFNWRILKFELADKKRDKPIIVQVDQWADASVLAKVIAKARKSRTKVSIATRKPS